MLTLRLTTTNSPATTTPFATLQTEKTQIDIVESESTTTCSPAITNPLVTLQAGEFTQVGIGESDRLQSVEFYEDELVGVKDSGERVKFNKFLSSKIPDLKIISTQVFKDNYSFKVSQFSEGDYRLQAAVRGVGGFSLPAFLCGAFGGLLMQGCMYFTVRYSNPARRPTILRLCDAAYLGDIEEVKRFLLLRFDINKPVDSFSFFAREFGERGNSQIYDRIARRENPNQSYPMTEYGTMTVLSHAVASGIYPNGRVSLNEEVIQTLLRKGADPKKALITWLNYDNQQRIDPEPESTPSSWRQSGLVRPWYPIEFHALFGTADSIQFLMSNGFEGVDEALQIVTPYTPEGDAMLSVLIPDRADRVNNLADTMTTRTINLLRLENMKLTGEEETKFKKLLYDALIKTKAVTYLACASKKPRISQEPAARERVCESLVKELKNNRYTQSEERIIQAFIDATENTQNENNIKDPKFMMFMHSPEKMNVLVYLLGEGEEGRLVDEDDRF